MGVRDVRRVRLRVPGGHRARRHDHGDAPQPGDDGVAVPARSDRGCSTTSSRRATRGASPATRACSGRRAWRTKVPVIPAGRPIPDDVEYLFFVGCAGASDDRAIKTTRAVADSVGQGRREVRRPRPPGDLQRRPCPAHRQRVPVPGDGASRTSRSSTATGVKKIITQCPHCFNTFRNEYPDYGGITTSCTTRSCSRELIGDGQAEADDAARRCSSPITTPATSRVTTTCSTDPRNVITATGARQTEMHRCGKRTFCCGAGGARFFMEETEGKRINVERIEEALGTERRHRRDVPVRSASSCSTTA